MGAIPSLIHSFIHSLDSIKYVSMRLAMMIKKDYRLNWMNLTFGNRLNNSLNKDRLRMLVSDWRDVLAYFSSVDPSGTIFIFSFFFLGISESTFRLLMELCANALNIKKYVRRTYCRIIVEMSSIRFLYIIIYLFIFIFIYIICRRVRSDQSHYSPFFVSTPPHPQMLSLWISSCFLVLSLILYTTHKVP